VTSGTTDRSNRRFVLQSDLRGLWIGALGGQSARADRAAAVPERGRPFACRSGWHRPAFKRGADTTPRLPPYRRRESASRQRGKRRPPVCRSFLSTWSRSSVSSTFQDVSRDVTRARECPPVPKCTRLVPAKRSIFAIAGNTICPFARLFCKPSDGLEPSTPSYHGTTPAIGRNPQQRFSPI
jgi:hypothetical protein